MVSQIRTNNNRKIKVLKEGDIKKVKYDLLLEHYLLTNDIESKDVYQLVIDGKIIVAIDENDYEEVKEYLENEIH